MPKLSLPQFTFINGPAGSGKSTLASLLTTADDSMLRMGFADPIRDMVYNVFFSEQGPIHYDLDLRDGEVKKRQFPFSDTATFRDVMISFSEVWMKPHFGDDIFGRLLMKRATENQHFYSRFVVDDSGFKAEAEFIIKMVGKENCTLIRLHRNGCNFSNDSRGYIVLPIKSLDLANDGRPEAMLSELELHWGNL